MTARRHENDTRDAGMTMMDLVVSMSIMLVVTSMLTGGLVQAYRALTRTETNSAAQSQINTAVVRLDRQVRYAKRINLASTTSMRYEVVEQGVSRCYETQVNAQVLRQRWKPASGTFSAWMTLASGISAATFTRLDPTDTTEHQRLQVVLTARSPGGASTTKQIDVTFTALNTKRDSPTDAC